MDHSDEREDAGATMHRQWRRRCIAIAAGGVALMASRVALAARNDPLRRALRYQDTPKGEQRCGGCLHYVANNERGGCKIMPGDDEVSPTGWCISWVAATPR